MSTSRDDRLSLFLGAGIESLDLPEEQYVEVEVVYKAASSFLRDYWSDSLPGGSIYPQGSMRLGTVIKLIHDRDEYDLDMVCRHDLEKTDTTKAELKAEVGFALEQFAKSRPDLGLSLGDEGRRCWTFKHESRPFHIDILPSIPDPKRMPTGILVTDRQAFQWHHSAPIDYADWFLSVQREEWEKGAQVVAAQRQMDIEMLPRHAFKTTLQQAVQVLKRHRDIYFTQDLKNRPASIIITTLAAQAYEPNGNLISVLRNVISRMPTLVNQTAIGYEVLNPVQPSENFADRWRGHPKRARRFFEWMKQAQKDLDDLSQIQGIQELLAKTESVLGEGPAVAAERAAGQGLLNARLAGALVMNPTTGVLSNGGVGVIVASHDFHGDQ